MNEGSSEYPAYKVPTGWAQGTFRVGTAIAQQLRSYQETASEQAMPYPNSGVNNEGVAIICPVAPLFWE